jgi:hypothetical protein
VYLALRVEQFLAGGPVRFRGAYADQDGGGVEHQFPAPSQQPGRLWYPADRVAPQAGAAFGDGQVETVRRQRDSSSVGLDERERNAGPVLAAPRGLQLGGSYVDPGRPGAAPGQPGREVRRPAAELDDVQAADITEHTKPLLGHVEDAPGDVLGGPGAVSVLIGVFAVRLGPQLPVVGNPIRPGSGLGHPYHHHASRRHAHATISAASTGHRERHLE